MKIVADANIPYVKDCFSSIGDIEVVSGREITPAVLRQADCLLVRSITRVDSQLLADSKVRFVATATIGTDHIDTKYLAKNNIGFASAPGSNANSVAEYIVAAMLDIAEKKQFELQGKSIGVIGAGNVGSEVALKAGSLGMKVYLNDPPLQRQTSHAKYWPLEELFDCDFITLHTPLTFEGVDKTFHLADEKFFKCLKKGCVFFNTSRGGVVETDALKNAVKSGKIKAAVLDVWENEPNIDAELFEMVDIGTPHIAGYSFDGKVVGMIMIYNSACQYFGIEAKFNKASFLPEPVVKELEIKSQVGSEQQVLAQAVKTIYDICEDDRELRQICDMPAEQRGGFFDKLRKEYPVRREFSNTTITIEDSNSRLADKLKGIGFKEK